MADPSLAVVQAFGAVGGDGVDGVASEQWLRSQLREHERGGGTVPGGPGAGRGYYVPTGNVSSTGGTLVVLRDDVSGWLFADKNPDKPRQP